ncbi:E3 ubiquitin/ISG15 ligase TRIM25 [Xenopus laevis]|uniref:E3 ubiquitin/ISG15 ligase TRIM25 n=2 Tax=Xenopus laevis TaxID=8355 RepID=A0A1L8H7P8_XENLA|nr:E3 ubiquitin/ISG15 ligase TRIM25 [Xenopus laevis]OCT92124.1 hypothetical protein XELAEV_18015181mg [Xenopus laevis]
MASAVLSDELTCSICLSIYRDPVMLPCGHHFCDHCIVRTLDSQTSSGIYNCPECRAEFKQRPSLQKNLKLSNIVEHYLCTQSKEEKSEVFCTYCINSPVLAMKTCLLCEASLCDRHLRTHSKSEKHVLIEPTASKEEKNKCLIHKELLKYFCTQDSALICLSCSKDNKHQGHNLELINDAFEKKKTALFDFLQKINSRKTENDKQLWMLQERKKKVQGKASDIKERVAALFRDIREEVLALENKVINEVNRQEEKLSCPLASLIKNLEIESADLHAKRSHIEELCSVTEPADLLKQPAISINLGKKDFFHHSEDLDEVLIAMTLQKGLSMLPDTITKLKKSRGFLVEDNSDMILNVNTACVNIALSPDLRKASYCHIEKSRPHHPERFITQQVLSTQRFTSGQHYWEVGVSDEGDWSVGVTYNSVKRKGDISCIGQNYKSWCLNWLKKVLSAEYNNEQDDIYEELSQSTLGIYLDYEGGRLSFYKLSSPIIHLHTFRVTFTAPLHAAFYLHNKGWIHIGK